MKHTRSGAETEIREPVVDRLRVLLPGCRIVHEMNVAGQGSRRVDVAAVQKDYLVTVEIKSEKDMLKRLPEQYEAFSKCSHNTIVVAHEKHFVEVEKKWGGTDIVLDCNGFSNAITRDHVWQYPRPEKTDRPWLDYLWTLSRFSEPREPEPRAFNFLDMLWRDELHFECNFNRISANTRSTKPQMIRDMIWQMTGKEICHAVCRQLRGREFAEADEPILEAA